MVTSIFIIDDNPTDCFIAEKLIKLTHKGSQVSTFTNPLQALERLQVLLKDNPSLFPQIIFLDINMPVMDGWGFLEKYTHLTSQNTSHCSLFMLSSSSNTHDINKARQYSFVRDYFNKPLSIENMQKAFVTIP